MVSSEQPVSGAVGRCPPHTSHLRVENESEYKLRIVTYVHAPRCTTHTHTTMKHTSRGSRRGRDRFSSWASATPSAERGTRRRGERAADAATRVAGSSRSSPGSASATTMETTVAVNRSPHPIACWRSLLSRSFSSLSSASSCSNLCTCAVALLWPATSSLNVCASACNAATVSSAASSSCVFS